MAILGYALCAYVLGIAWAIVWAIESMPTHARVTLVLLSPIVLIALAWLVILGALYVARSWLQTARWLRRKWRLRKRAAGDTAPQEGVYRSPYRVVSRDARSVVPIFRAGPVGHGVDRTRESAPKPLIRHRFDLAVNKSFQRRNY